MAKIGFKKINLRKGIIVRMSDQPFVSLLKKTNLRKAIIVWISDQPFVPLQRRQKKYFYVCARINIALRAVRIPLS